MYFPTTHWSLLAKATSSGDDEARRALEELYRRYWSPLHQFIRLRGYTPMEAQDLTQEFLLELLKHATLKRADGDGQSDAHESLAGTDPNNPASVFRILAIEPEAGGVRIAWSTVGGSSYVVQTNGDLAQPFADFSSLILAPGSGESTAKLPDAGASAGAARYYRVRLEP